MLLQIEESLLLGNLYIDSLNNIFEKTIEYYKELLLSDNISNNDKYNSCLSIYNLCCKNKKNIELGIYYLVQSYKYNESNIECTLELIKYYSNMNMYQVAFSYYKLIQNEYENNYLNTDNLEKDFYKIDLLNPVEELKSNINRDFYLPYYMIKLLKNLNKNDLIIKMFEIIFYTKPLNVHENLISDLFFILKDYISLIDKNNILFNKNCEDYIKLLKLNNYNIIFDKNIIKTTKNNFIKIINLEKRKDRKENTINEFENNGLSKNYYDFIVGIDGYKLSPILELKNLFDGNDFGNRKGVIGCALSHYNLWLKLLEDTKNDYYLIMEDDFTLSNNFLIKINSLFDDFKNKDLFFLGYHMFEKNRQNNFNIYNDQNNSTKIELLNHNLYIGGTFSYSINKNGAKKIIDYIKKNGIKHGIDWVMKIIPDLEIYELQPQIVFSEWNENGAKIDSDIQNLYDSIDFSNIESINSYDNFIFIPGLDYSEYDLYCKKDTILNYMKIAENDNNCMGFNTVGYFKSYINIHSLFKSPYFRNDDGIYIKKEYYEKYKKLFRIKMLCNWCSSEQLCREWSNMCENNYIWKNIEITWSNENIDYYVIINKPCNDEYYDPSKKIVFQMEPWVNDLNKNWGVKTWGIWAIPDSKNFLEVCGRKTSHHNNCFWQLEISYNDLMHKKIEKKNIISTICSSKYFDEGHIARIDLLKYIESKNDPTFIIDIYNQDNNHEFKNYKGPVTPYIDKSKGMISYKYYFMIENNYEKNFITEKLWEPILCESLVFYYGCPNVSDYINPLAYVLLDVNDFEKSYQIIKNAIEEDLWAQRINIIREEKNKILNNYSFFPKIHNIISNNELIIKIKYIFNYLSILL
jgi:GR25 family glycosyltransferase involved in LPS biosynthesis